MKLALEDRKALDKKKDTHYIFSMYAHHLEAALLNLKHARERHQTGAQKILEGLWFYPECGQKEKFYFWEQQFITSCINYVTELLNEDIEI